MNNQLTKSPILILLIIFLEGFVSISIEIFTIRQLIPVAGTSIIVTSIIIGIFLLFLALGYCRGGLYKEKFISILKRNFIVAAGLMGIGISYPFIIYFFTAIEQLLPNSNLLVALTIYSTLIIAPTIYLLGQTIPLTMNLMDQHKRTAEIGGKVLFLSTLGSFLGALLTSLLLMEFLGVAWTIFINFLILMALAWFFTKRKNWFLYLIITIGMGIVIYKFNVSFEKEHFITTTNYANYNVLRDATIKSTRQTGDLLISNNLLASFIDKQKRNFPYIEIIKRILFQDLKLHDTEMLVLGAGGFTLSAAETHGNHFTYVDIDPKIKSIVEKNFLNKINGEFVAQDARIYLTKHPKEYDVIISDVYSNFLSIPSSLITYEYFNSIKNALKPKGTAIFNIMAKPFLNDNFSKRVDSTIRAVFTNCLAIPLTYSDNYTNIIYVCRINKNQNDKTIYTDNLNSAEIDSISLFKGNHSKHLGISNFKKLESLNS